MMRGWRLGFALLLAACSGGGAMPNQPVASKSPQTLVPTTFVFALSPAASSASARRPQYVTANVASVQIVLITVNGGAPPAGVTPAVTTNVTLASCPCTVAGPAVPPGSDAFTITTYDAPNAGGNIVSTASPTFTIVANQANSNTIALNGVPASLAMMPPSGTAGTAFAATALSVTVKDADGNTILGTYANPVTLADNDSSGATALVTSGSDSPPTGQLLSSSDVAKLSYSGLAIVPLTLTASASGATSAHASFAPALQQIVYTGPLVNSSPEIDLFATSGVGSSATFTATEVGWTNAPYNKGITATSASGCSNIATTAPATGTSFTTTVATSPSAGTCTLTLSDFTGGSTTSVTLTYTATPAVLANGSAATTITFVALGATQQVSITETGAPTGTYFNAAVSAGCAGFAVIAGNPPAALPAPQPPSVNSVQFFNIGSLLNTVSPTQCVITFTSSAGGTPAAATIQIAAPNATSSPIVQ